MMTREEFLAHTILLPNGCREWVGRYSGRQYKGYGQVVIDGKHWSTHRLAWVLFRGPIPKGRDLCHACNNDHCVNTEGTKHLYLGDKKTNHNDMVKAGTWTRGHVQGQTPLHDVDVLEIVAWAKSGEPHISIARHFGIRASIRRKLPRVAAQRVETLAHKK